MQKKTLKSKIKEERVKEDLKDIKEILDKHNIKYWLDWGSALGAVREGKMIEWDNDVELGMMEGEFKKISSILPEIRKKGFGMHKTPLPFLRYSFKRSEWPIDTWFYSQLDKDNFVTYIVEISLTSLSAQFLWHIWLPFICVEKNIDLKIPYNRFGLMPHKKFRLMPVLVLKYFLTLFPYKVRKFFAELTWEKLIKNNRVKMIKSIVPKHFFEKFRKIKFHGLTFNIPFKAEEYVEYKYGKDWRIPRKKWVWHKEDGSVIKNKCK